MEISRRGFLRRVFGKGSQKGGFRGSEKAKFTPFREYDPLPVCPIHGLELSTVVSERVVFKRA